MAFGVGLAALVGAVSAGAAVPVEEAGCSALVEAQGKIDVVNDTNIKVLEQTANGDFLYKRENARAIRCLRSDLVPAVNDYKVLAAGYPLYIMRAAGAATRMGILEVSSGQFRFRLLQGELTSDEMQRLRLRLNEIQEAARPR